ncbi:hypothetical protein [Methylobacterium sp. J-067]|uniref:hypothetical protein n=1 Tax=Methylobacterium sp. J-067 TaxID=2836648 RepID=UPI001FB9DEF0|nr:hypothetical protein [Methylobacterium sp. J-067]MCJ2026450.1 hypothetical protein [Methylobacterium sp. J-067]
MSIRRHDRTLGVTSATHSGSFVMPSRGNIIANAIKARHAELRGIPNTGKGCSIAVA